MICNNIQKYCKNYQNIENFDKALADETQVWDCHHRLETETSDGIERPKDAQLSFKELKALGMYYNRPSEELIFLTHSEHRSLHQKGKSAWNKGKPTSEEAKQKQSKAHKKKPVTCMETGISYCSVNEAQRQTGSHHISEACKDSQKTSNGFHWKYVD